MFEFGEDWDLDLAFDDDYINAQYPSLGRYQPATASAAADALHWVPYATAVTVVRGLLGASHEDLRVRLKQLTRSLSMTFFPGRDAMPAVGKLPPTARWRFPEGALYVCADRPPIAKALQDVSRAMTQVAVKDACHGSCDCYYDVLGHLMRLLVDDNGVVGSAVYDRAAFEAEFKLEWVPE